MAVTSWATTWESPTLQLTRQPGKVAGCGSCQLRRLRQIWTALPTATCPRQSTNFRQSLAQPAGLLRSFAYS